MPDPRFELLKAMRQQGNETQLTRAIAALGRHDPGAELATEIARAIVATAAERGNRASAAMLKRIPESLAMSNEAGLSRVQIRRRKASGGRVDWEMTNDDFSLKVEVKIGAAVATRQLERYLNAFSKSKVEGGLVLLTRATEAIPAKVERHDRWLGQIRWDELIPRLIAITPADPVIAAEWKLLLSVICEQGDLADEPVDWQLGGRKVGARNRLVLSAVRDLASSTVAVELARRTDRPTSDGLCRNNPGAGTRSVVIAGDRARLGLYVPVSAKRGPVIDIDLEGTRKPLKLTTYVNQGPAPMVRRKAKYDAALKELEANGFSKQNDGEHAGWYAAHDRVAPTQTAATPDAALWEKLEGRLIAIVASGTLDSLVP